MQRKNYALAKRTRKQQGMTLLEMVITIAIVGILSIGIMRLAQTAIEYYNMSSLVTSLNSLRFAGIQTYRSAYRYPEWDANYPNFITFNLVNLGKVSEKDGINPFNNDIIPFLTFGKSNNHDRRAFALAVEDITQDQCKNLVTRVADAFPYIAVQQQTNANYIRVPYEKAVADATSPTGVIKSIAPDSVNLDLNNMDHTENLCGGPSDEARSAAYTVYLGSL